ncbi:MAG: hypothetical protein EAZ97_01270 [Bacteroidetes bacterium]|nr:MAG: hypothetical protein EAZ97_01270 [Bacteroidota bacterium]
MPVRMVSDDDEEEDDDATNEGSDDDNEESEGDYDYLIGERIYVGRNDNTGVNLFKGAGTSFDTHAQLSSDDLEEADYFVGVGERLKVADGITWLKLKYAKPVWLPLEGSDVETD